MPQRRLPDSTRRWLRTRVDKAPPRTPRVRVLGYLVATTMLLGAAAGTAVAVHNARRSVAQVRDLHDVPWVGGDFTVTKPGSFSMYRVQSGYGNLPSAPMPAMWVYAPNGLPMRLTRFIPESQAAQYKKDLAAKIAKNPSQSKQIEAAAIPLGRSIQVGDITAEEVGTVEIAVPGTYEVRFSTPMRVGDALLVGPPVDAYVSPMLTGVKVAVVLEVLGLVVLVLALGRHLMSLRVHSLSTTVLKFVHRVGSGDRLTFPEVAKTFGAPARSRSHSHRDARQSGGAALGPVIDLTTVSPRPSFDPRPAPPAAASMRSDLPDPPASAAPRAAARPADSAPGPLGSDLGPHESAPLSLGRATRPPSSATARRRIAHHGHGHGHGHGSERPGMVLRGAPVPVPRASGQSRRPVLSRSDAMSSSGSTGLLIDDVLLDEPTPPTSGRAIQVRRPRGTR